MADESYVSTLLKDLVIPATGVAAGALGIPGSAISLLASGGQWLNKRINPEDTFIQNALGYLKKGGEAIAPESLQRYAEQLTGGYVKPETGFQKGLSEYSQDIGGILGIGGKAKTALKLATLGNVPKQAASLMGASESTANTAKLVGMLTSPVFKFNNLKSTYKQLYDDVRSTIGPETMAPGAGLYKASKDVIEKASKGGSVAYKNAVKRFSNSVMEKTKEGQIPIEELWDFKKDLNDMISRGVFAKNKRALLEPLEKSIRSNLKQYAVENKDFGYALENADTLFGIEKNLPFLDRAINKTIGLKDSGLSEYFRKSLVWGVGGLKGLFAKQALGSLSKRGEAFLSSPAYRQASVELAKATAKQSTPMAINALRKLKTINKDFSSGFTNNSGGTFTIVNKSSETKPSTKQNSGKFTTLTKEDLQNKMANLS